MTHSTTVAGLADLYTRPGPFVTVYLDASRTTETGAHEVETRWRDLRSTLSEQDADEATLDSVEPVIAGDRGTPGQHGLVVVAAGGEVLLAETLADPPARDQASVAPLPRLLPYVASRARDVPHVVVVTDRTGADVLSVAGNASSQAVVAGDTSHPVHQHASADWSERHFQQRVENTWRSNARDVAAEVTKESAAIGADLVVVAGDVRARSLVADALRDSLPERVTVVGIDEGGRAAGSSTTALQEAVRTQVLLEVARQRDTVLERLQQNVGRGELGVAGAGAVADAVRTGRADTVVLSDDPSSTLRAWVGPEPIDFGLDDAQAAEAGIDQVEHDRFDSALVRGVIGTGARLLVVPGPHRFIEDGIGALLRYDHQ